MPKSEKSRSDKSFGGTSFLMRLLASLVLVLATYNPSEFSYYHWLTNVIGNGGPGPVHFFVGVVLLIGWVIFLIATKRSLGTLGTALGAALLAMGIWVLVDFGIIRAGSATAIAWLALISLAILLAIGLSWAHIWRRLSGQLEVDDTND